MRKENPYMLFYQRRNAVPVVAAAAGGAAAGGAAASGAAASGIAAGVDAPSQVYPFIDLLPLQRPARAAGGAPGVAAPENPFIDLSPLQRPAAALLPSGSDLSGIPEQSAIVAPPPPLPRNRRMPRKVVAAAAGGAAAGGAAGVASPEYPFIDLSPLQRPATATAARADTAALLPSGSDLSGSPEQSAIVAPPPPLPRNRRMPRILGPRPPVLPAYFQPLPRAAGPAPSLPRRFFSPEGGFEFSETVFRQLMGGRRGARRGVFLGNIPYSSDIVETDYLRTLDHGKYVQGEVLAFIIGVMQAENIELCAASPPAPFSPANPAICRRGPTRLARVLFFSSSVPLPRSMDSPPAWDCRHFVDLGVLDVVCVVKWLGGNHYAVFMLDLRGRALYYFDSIRCYARAQATAYAKDILLWAETLGKLLDVAEFSDATTWQVQYCDGGDDGYPRQGRATAKTKSRAAGWDVGVDCALFAGSAAASVARGEQFAHRQDHMASLRRQAAFLILHWWQFKGEEAPLAYDSLLVSCVPPFTLLQLRVGCCPPFLPFLQYRLSA